MSRNENLPKNQLLLRRLNPDWFDSNRDPPIKSQAFQNYLNEKKFSVTVYKSEEDIEAVLEGMDGHGVAQIELSACLEENLEFEPDPIPDNKNHGHLCGKVTRGMRKRLARKAQILIVPKKP